jgi:hypothetical protein
MVKKLLIIGDSFSASTDANSWCSSFNGFETHNMSMSGSSEYRLIKQLNSLDTSKYHNVIFVHTSPNRIYVEQNPYYQCSDTHNNCDLIFQDIHARLPDPYATNVVWWFENVFDLEQAMFNHNLLIDHALKKLSNALHLTFFDYAYPGVHSLHKIWKSNPGTINHMSAAGNQAVVQVLKDIWKPQ